LAKPALPPKNKTGQCPNILVSPGLRIPMLFPQTKIKKPSRLNQNGLLVKKAFTGSVKAG